MTFPTQTDLDYYQSKRRPAWAARIERKGWRGPETPWADLLVNAHAEVYRTAHEVEAHNMCVLIKGCIRRGEPVVPFLRRLVKNPSGLNPKQRSRLARKWLRKGWGHK